MKTKVKLIEDKQLANGQWYLKGHIFIVEKWFMGSEFPNDVFALCIAQDNTFIILGADEITFIEYI